MDELRVEKEFGECDQFGVAGQPPSDGVVRAVEGGESDGVLPRFNEELLAFAENVVEVLAGLRPGDGKADEDVPGGDGS